MTNWIVTQKNYVDYDGENHGEVPDFLVCDVPEDVELTIEKVKQLFRQARLGVSESSFQEVFRPIENGGILRVADKTIQEFGLKLLRFQISYSHILFWDGVSSVARKDSAISQLREHVKRLLNK